MKFTKTKITVLALFLTLLLILLGATAFVLTRESKPELMSQSASGNHIAETFFEDQLDKRIAPLLGSIEDRVDLLSENVKMKAAAEPLAPLTAQYNAYVSLQRIESNNYQDALSVRATVSAKKLMKDFGDRLCPISPMTSASGSTMEEMLTRSIVLHYFIQNDARNPYEYSTKSFPFRTLQELANDLSFEDAIPIYMLGEGTHTISVVPGCSTKDGAHELFNEAMITTRFDKQQEPLELYEVQNNKDPLLRIVSPKISYEQPGMAELAIPYTVADHDAVRSVTLNVPYIQTSSSFTIEAESILPGESTGALYRAQFDMYKGDKLLASSLSQSAGAASFGTKTRWYGNFSSLEKGDYTLIARLLKTTNGKTEIVKRSKVSHIGIGDIMVTLGDSTVTAPQGAMHTGSMGSDREAGRGKAQPGKGCEFKLTDGQNCTGTSLLYYSFTRELSEILSEKKQYPVLVLHEGAPAGSTLDYISSYYANSTTPLKKRIQLLSPTQVLVQLSSGVLPQDQQEHFEQSMTTLKESLKQLLDERQIPIYLALPQFEDGVQENQQFALAMKKFAQEDGSFMPGPNLYKLFFEELFSPKQNNLYKQNAFEKTYTNELGQKKLAQKWAEFLE